MKKDLLFYDAYEKFYVMVRKSECFKKYCKTAFGEDFSQDGFSNINQINLILQNIPKTNNLHILNIGCGNGKMLKYLQDHSGGYIYGFDFLENAIETARLYNPIYSDFRVGVIGEIEYPMQSFDLIVSMDTIYFAKDMKPFVGQVKKWLKDGGIFFIRYQEGDIMPKTVSVETTKIAKALKANSLKYDVINYTKQTYDMLKHKRETIIKFKDDFEKESILVWFKIILNQTNSVTVPYENMQGIIHDIFLYQDYK